jgi:hypothetical protein
MDFKKIKVKEISFDTLKTYWTDQKHFDADHDCKEVVRYLGTHINAYTDPKRKCYGLYYLDEIIGGTQLVQWNEDVVRYRTINVKPKYRGYDLGWYLIQQGLQDFQCSKLFGWIKHNHIDWAKKHGFYEVDHCWTDKHIAMYKNLN